MKIKKKWLIIIGSVAALGLIAVLVIFNMDWGNEESEIDPSDTVECDLASLEGTYVSNPNPKKSEILFKIDGPKSATGKFNKFSAELQTVGSLEDAQLTVTVDVGSISTNNDTRDEHLREEDFFYVSKFPDITFTSDKITQVEGNEYKVTGTIEMMGIEKDFSFNFTHVGCNPEDSESEYVVFEASFDFHRIDYGMEEETSVGNVAEVTIYVEMVKGEISEEDLSAEDEDFIPEDEGSEAEYEGDEIDERFDRIEEEAAAME